MDTVDVLSGIKVLEFGHAVMGPCAGVMLADNGADVTIIEPTGGSSTRKVGGFGSGIFTCYNRNKKSFSLDIKSEEGRKIIYELIESTDVVIENFGPGTMDRLGFGYEKLAAINEQLIYCSLKGFFPGPYGKRHAMDEVIQMMGGLAYMTGRKGDPLRAGASLLDVMGAMFGYIGILQALLERKDTHKGKKVMASLYETCAFLMGQHMAYQANVDYPIPPMPNRENAWSIYQIFDTKDNQKIFIGIISDKHWDRFCQLLGKNDWAADESLATNAGRVTAGDWLLPAIGQEIKRFNSQEIIAKLLENQIPFSEIREPKDLFEDVHLKATNGLSTIEKEDNSHVMLPKFPLMYGDTSYASKYKIPSVGSNNSDTLKTLGYTDKEILDLEQKGIIG